MATTAQAVTATNTPTVTLTATRRYSKSMAVVSTPTVAITRLKHYLKTMAVVNVPVIATSRAQRTAKAMAVVASSVVGMVRKTTKTIAATSTPITADFKKKIGFTMETTSTPIAALAHPSTRKRTLAVTAANTVKIVRKTGKQIILAITPTVLLTKGKIVYQVLTVVSSPVVALTKTWLGALWLRIKTVYPTLKVFRNDNEE